MNREFMGNLKFFLAILVIFICVTSRLTEAQTNIQNHEIKGNLKSDKTVDCVAISDLTTEHSPADIFPGARKCIDKQDYTRAADLFLVAFTYGRYDIERVLDKSAHQAVAVLKLNSFENLDQVKLDAFQNAIKSRIEKASSNLAGFCSRIKVLGLPTYHPTYMLKHGMSAFTGSGGGIKADFNQTEVWKSLLDSSLHCPK